MHEQGSETRRMLSSQGSKGCTNFVVNTGVCVRHGAKVKRCSSKGCTNHAKKGGVCVRHGITSFAAVKDVQNKPGKVKVRVLGIEGSQK